VPTGVSLSISHFPDVPAGSENFFLLFLYLIDIFPAVLTGSRTCSTLALKVSSRVGRRSRGYPEAGVWGREKGWEPESAVPASGGLAKRAERSGTPYKLTFSNSLQPSKLEQTQAKRARSALYGHNLVRIDLVQCINSWSPRYHRRSFRYHPRNPRHHYPTLRSALGSPRTAAR
jgi:hypothetical protein